jgi:hypothetical protein
MLLAVALATFAPVHAAPVTFTEFSMGDMDFLKVMARASEFPQSDKYEASLAVAPDGRVAVAWQSRRQLNGHSGVYYREFSPMGASLTPELRAGAVTGFHESKPAVAYGEGLLAFHESSWRDDSGAGVFVGKKAVPQSLRGDQTDITATKLPSGRVLAVWSSQISRTERRIFGRVFSAVGKPVGDEFRISNFRTGSEVLPSVTADARGAIVAWQRLGEKGKPGGVWAARVSTHGVATPVLVAPLGVEPSVSSAGNTVLLGWAEPTGSGYRARAAFLQPNLSFSRALDLPAQAGLQNATAVATRPDGTAAVAWNYASGDAREIWLRVFPASGQAEPAAKIHAGALAEATGRQRIAWSGEKLCIAWSGDAGLGDPKAAHLTLLIPRAEATASDIEALAKTSVVPIAPVTSLTSSGSAVQFVAQAGPHEPPAYNPKARLDPWGVQSPDMGGNGFNAVVSTGWTPPDPHMAVGPSHVGVMTNGQIAFFTKDGTNVFRDEIEDSFGFWGAVGATNFVFDPEIIYDTSVGRWMAMACERGSNARSYFLLAVSDDSDPTGTWFKYRLDVTTQGGGSDIDSPNMSTDDEAVYLSADFFNPTQKYLVFILKKSDLIAGSPTPLTRHHLITGTQSHGMPMTYDAAAPQYLIEHFEATSNTTVRLHAITDPLGTPTRTSFTLPVPAYGRPENPPQAGTSVRPTAFDSRFWSCVYRNGSLWATHHINSSRVLARWYEIKMNNWPNGGTPELVQSGQIDPGGTVRTFFSSIAVDAFGNAAVICARSSPTEFISMYKATRRADDPLGTMPDAAIVKESDGPYFTSRWGDYSAIAVDPVDNRTFWAHHEYSVGGSWHTWVASFESAVNWIEKPVEQILPILAGPITGGLPEIAVADNVLMRVDSVVNPPYRPFSSMVDYVATAPPGQLVALKFRVVAKSGNGDGLLRVTVFNRQTGMFDHLGTETINLSALSTLTFAANFDVNRYVNPSNRQILMRMQFDLGNQPSRYRPPLLIDEIKFLTGF